MDVMKSLEIWWELNTPRISLLFSQQVLRSYANTSQTQVSMPMHECVQLAQAAAASLRPGGNLLSMSSGAAGGRAARRACRIETDDERRAVGKCFSEGAAFLLLL